MFDFQAYLARVRAELERYLRQQLSDEITAVRGEVEDFLAHREEDLKRWTGQLVQGQLTADEFGSLVRGQVGLLKLHALEQAGLAEIRVDEIRAAVVGILVDSVLHRVG